MKDVKSFEGIFIHRDPVDMRKGINGLSEVVQLAEMGELTGSYLFVFAGRRRDLIKILYFDKTGFAMWQKRLEKARFPWPKKQNGEVIRVSPEQMAWLLDGYNIWKMRPFETLNFEKVV